MSTLWNPRKPLNQPPHFGIVGAAETVDSKQFDAALQKAKDAHYDSQAGRRKRSTERAIFDRSTKGSR